jgi:hydrogenase expression/formation protein HypE
MEIQLAHGGGGKMGQALLDHLIVPAFSNPALEARHDGAVVAANGARLAFSTDTHVVRPLFFPGGDIGRLAVFGTANDIAMCGARPKWLSAAFVLEEGLPVATLQRVVESMRDAAAEAGVEIVTGDTKTVERGKGDGLYVNTSGIGVIEHDRVIAPRAVRAGDVVLLSGDVGRHGMAVMAQREGLAFESSIESDLACLWPAVEALLAGGLDIHCLRDLTRGGLGAALVEIAETAGVGMELSEPAIRVEEPVRGACEILGLDPLHVANEGRFIVFLPAAQAGRAMDILSRTAPGGPPAKIGSVRDGPAGQVALRNALGFDRILDRPSGEQLPRIC